MKRICFVLMLFFSTLVALMLFMYMQLQKTIVSCSPSDIITMTKAPMKITSTIFKSGEMIPAKYTCDGEGLSPPLYFHDIPKEAKSLVLIVDDPDVPSEIRADRNWDHWIVFNIPPDTTQIGENQVPAGSKLGMNSSGTFSYISPCPPSEYEPKKHRYFFKLYALDSNLALLEGAAKIDVEAEMNGRVLDSAELIGVYERQ